LSLRERTLDLLNVLLILKTSIMTRISGYGQVGRQHFMMIPIGGKSVLAAGETYIGIMEKLINELKKEHDRHPDQKWLKDISIGLRDLLGQANFRLSSPKHDMKRNVPEQRVSTYLSTRISFASRFEDAIYNGFHKLLDWEPMELGYISGGLLIVPFADKMMQQQYLMQIEKNFRESKDGELWKKMRGICADDEDKDKYPESIQSAMKDALDLIAVLSAASPEKTQLFTQDSHNPDQYYAIPLLTFMHGEMMKKYFASGKGKLEDDSFRSLLATYTRTLYPVSGILPIGDNYGEFPFVVFRSFNLKDVRSKIFSDSHLFISHEMNVLNMILSYREEQK